MSFGIKTTTAKSQVDHLINTVDAIRPITAELLSRKAYHQDFGICDHVNNDPLDLVRMHPKENFIEGGPRRTWQRKYVNFRLANTTNLNITEFFQLPYPDACFLVELSQSVASNQANVLGDLDRELKKM